MNRGTRDEAAPHRSECGGTRRRLSRRHRRVSSAVAQPRATKGTLRHKKTRRSGARRLSSRSTNVAIAPVVAPPVIVDLDRFTASLKTAWRDGERRPTHRRPYRRRKPIPKRPSMIDEVQDQICAWLDGEPSLSGLEVLGRLKLIRPDRFSDRHLRTVQRAVKAWRSQQARRIIAESAAVIDPQSRGADRALPDRYADTGDHHAVAAMGF